MEKGNKRVAEAGWTENGVFAEEWAVLALRNIKREAK